MKLVTFLTKGGPRAGRLEGDSIVEIGSSLKEIFVVDPVDTLRRKKGLTYPVDKVKLLAPIPDPGLVLSVGMNYHEHLKEMKTPVPEKPAAFTKSVASIIASGEPIRLPASHAGMVDWEGELSVVIALSHWPNTAR